jgi:uncharacterized protein
MTSFNVAGLLREPPGTYRDYHLRDQYVALGPDVELAGPIDLDLRLQRTNRGILVTGSASAPLRRTCARCLDAFVDDVTVSIEEEFLPSVDPESGAPLAAPEDDEQALTIDAHHEVVIDEVLHDELLLSEPMLPLCRPDCPGLCSICGERLAGEPHDHGPPEVDPRLAGLAHLLEDGNGTREERDEATGEE